MFALPAVAVLKLGGAPAVLWVDVVVFAAAAVAGARLPVPPARGDGRRGAAGGAAPPRGRRGPVDSGGAGAPSRSATPIGTWTEWTGDEDDLAAFRPIADPEVILALMPMSVLKGLVGFLTFLFAFGLRRRGGGHLVVRASLLGALTAGAVIGVLLVRRIRRSSTSSRC